MYMRDVYHQGLRKSWGWEEQKKKKNNRRTVSHTQFYVWSQGDNKLKTQISKHGSFYRIKTNVRITLHTNSCGKKVGSALSAELIK